VTGRRLPYISILENTSRRRRMFRGAVLLALVSVAFAQRNPSGATDSAELKALGAFVGKWKSVGEMFETRYSHAQKISSELTCVWAPNRQFLISDQIIKSADGRKDQLGVYGYDPQSKEYYSYAFFSTGGPPYISHPEITGNVWTYNGEFKGPGGMVRTRTTNTFVDGNTVVFETQFSDDGTHWVTMLKGKDIRAK
jgi:Protein of unknown function (DUF1579)